jgi:hypothetical protein
MYNHPRAFRICFLIVVKHNKLNNIVEIHLKFKNTDFQDSVLGKNVGP